MYTILTTFEAHYLIIRDFFFFPENHKAFGNRKNIDNYQFILIPYI